MNSIHSANFIMFLQILTDMNPKIWLQKGVAAFADKAD